MEPSRIAIQLSVAIVCALLGNILIPRQIPGKFFGLVTIGFLGVWFGEWGYRLLRSRYGLDAPFLSLSIQQVPLIPSVVGCAIVIYIVTTLLRWGRYSQ